MTRLFWVICLVGLLACEEKAPPPPFNPTTGAGGGGDATGGGGSETGGGGAASEVAYCGAIDLSVETGGDPAEPPETIASGVGFPTLVAVDDSRVYWADSPLDGSDGQIAAAPLGGGAEEILAATNVNAASGLVLSGDHVYWSNQDNPNLMRVPKTGGGEEVFASLGALVDLTGDAAQIYVPSFNAIGAYPTDGSESVTIATGMTNAIAVAVAGSSVYGADLGPAVSLEYSEGLIVRAAADGSGQDTLAEGVNRPTRIAAEVGTVVWLDGGTNAGQYLDGKLMLLAAPCGPDPVALVTEIPGGWWLALHDTVAFWSTTGGSVYSLDLKSGDLARHDDAAGSAPGLAANGTHLYWTSPDNGEIRRAPR